jgi:hypothetical protein
VSPRAALTSALLTTLATPATWPMAMAGFLLRGGLLVVTLPIVVLPSPVGIGNLLAPTLMTVVFSGISVQVVLLVGLLSVVIAGWVVLGGLLAAVLEAEAARMVAGDDALSMDARRRGRPPDGALDRGVAARILAARLVAHVPTGLAAILGSARLVTLAYRELTSPFDVATPIAVRVIRAAPEVVVAIVVTWMAGEIVGGMAARRIALDGAGVSRSLRTAVLDSVRHPVAVLLDFWVPLAVLIVVAIPSAIAASATWGLVRVGMRSPGEAAAATLAVVLFVAIWMVGLVLLAVTVAWRAAVWSVAHDEVERRQTVATGGDPG